MRKLRLREMKDLHRVPLLCSNALSFPTQKVSHDWSLNSYFMHMYELTA